MDRWMDGGGAFTVIWFLSTFYRYAYSTVGENMSYEGI